MWQVLEVGEFEFFDALYQRYSDPMPLLNQMAVSGQIAWFTRNLTNARVQEENERLMWDIWLHKVWDKDWNDFKRETMNKARNHIKNEHIRTHPEKTANIISKSRAILDQFERQ